MREARESAERPKESSAAEMLGRAYAATVCAMGLMKADFRRGRYSEEHYEALEEEAARLAKDTLQLAKTLGWARRTP